MTTNKDLLQHEAAVLGGMSSGGSAQLVVDCSDAAAGQRSSIYDQYSSTRRWFILAIVSITAIIVPLTDTIYLPGLEQLKRDYNTNQQLASASVAVYLAAVGFSALFWGPAADRFGRRPTYLVTVVSFLATTLGVSANTLTAVVGGCYNRQLEEFRIGFSVGDADEVIHGVVWPLLGAEDEMSDLAEEIEAGGLAFPGGIEGFLANRTAAARAEWRGAPRPHADDLKKAKAHEIWKRLGVLSDAMICNDLGADVDDVYQQLAAERQRINEALGRLKQAGLKANPMLEGSGQTSLPESGMQNMAIGRSFRSPSSRAT